MIRFIVAVVVGYLVTAVLVMAAFSVALAAPGFAFQGGGSEVTAGWLVYSIIASLVAATAGGYVAAVVARRRRAAFVLAGFLIVMGLGSAVANQLRARPLAEPPAGPSVLARAERAVQPGWYAFALPLLGAMGAALGGELRGRGPAGNRTDPAAA